MRAIGDELCRSIHRVSGIDVAIENLRWIIRFTDNTRHADAYRLGRVSLAGGAAHVHFPAGGTRAQSAGCRMR
ncbi:FAD-dependent monooxygenase [Nocardia paucivorans]|uniref:FAD-dependent monooxygenase n=1 Tax=Nocardia paucivorans TaxID=114259 RepID=UPI00031ED45F|nr:FAD-dependent monooxygenase [Nocardia paucivorans]